MREIDSRINVNNNLQVRQILYPFAVDIQISLFQNAPVLNVCRRIMEKFPRKISVKIWRPVIDKLTRKLDAACLRRDAYLNRVLETEISYLEHEVTRSNSEAARRFIADRIDHLDRKLVSLSLNPDLIDRLDKVCSDKLIVRDAFFNRLLFLLAASPKVIDRVFFPGEAGQWRKDVWSENKHDGPFFQNVFYPLEPVIDPFWPIREGIDLYFSNVDSEGFSVEEASRGGSGSHDNWVPYRLYTAILNDAIFSDIDLYGLNCYLPDSHVPGHPEEAKRRRSLDELLELFEGNSK